MSSRKLRTVLFGIVVLFSGMSLLYGEDSKEECSSLFKYRVFSMNELSFKESLKIVPELGKYTRMFRDSIKRIQQDRTKLTEFLEQNRSSLSQEQIGGIYTLIRVLNFQLAPISHRVLSGRIENIRKSTWYRDSNDYHEADTFSWSVEYIWYRFISIYAELYDITATPSISKLKKRDSVGGEKSSSMFGGRFPLIGVWAQAIEYTDSVFEKMVREIYSKTPIISKLIPDFESKYILQEDGLLPLRLIQKQLISYARSGIRNLIEKMNISEYIDFLRIVVGREPLEEFLKFEDGNEQNPRVYFISNFNEMYKNIKLSYRSIMSRFKDIRIDTFTDIKSVITVYKVVDYICEKVNLPSGVNKDLMSLIIAMDMWLSRSDVEPWEIIEGVCEAFNKLDNFSKAYFIAYIVKDYFGKDNHKMLETFSTRVLISSKDEVSKRLVETLIIPKLESYKKFGDVLLDALTFGVPEDFEM